MRNTVYLYIKSDWTKIYMVYFRLKIWQTLWHPNFRKNTNIETNLINLTPQDLEQSIGLVFVRIGWVSEE